MKFYKEAINLINKNLNYKLTNNNNLIIQFLFNEKVKA